MEMNKSLNCTSVNNPCSFPSIKKENKQRNGKIPDPKKKRYKRVFFEIVHKVFRQKKRCKKIH